MVDCRSMFSCTSSHLTKRQTVGDTRKRGRSNEQRGLHCCRCAPAQHPQCSWQRRPQPTQSSALWLQWSDHKAPPSSARANNFSLPAPT